ncbi:Uncharacterized protein SCF082_LOCUS51060, partial [Durusdinium trenchii]
MPTPAPAPGLDLSEIPDKGDNAVPCPKAGGLRISQSAINQRMGRVFQPNKRTGNFKVSKEILTMWHQKSGKTKLQQIFQTCGYDSFIEEVEILKEEIQSNELIVEGEYLSEEAMLTVWGWSQRISSTSMRRKVTWTEDADLDGFEKPTHFAGPPKVKRGDNDDAPMGEGGDSDVDSDCGVDSDEGKKG